MPQRLYSSSDQPDFHTYPAPPDQTARLEGIDARSEAPSVGESNKVTEIKQRSSEAVRKVAGYAGDLKANAAGKARELGNKAVDASRTAVRDYPLHVVAGAALLGVLMGAGLRYWRENRV